MSFLCATPSLSADGRSSGIVQDVQDTGGKSVNRESMA